MDFKQEYIKMRNAGNYDLQFFFNYYLSQGGIVKDGSRFTEHFLYASRPHPMMPDMMIRGEEVNRNEILKHMDGVFELTILSDKEGNFIKVIE